MTGSDQPDRDVSYHYGDVDPQAVDRLMPAGGGAALADMIYDPAGNLISKRAPAGSFQFVWDGDNQLREAETPSGLEAYYYDHNGQRVLAMTRNGGVRFWFGESETHYSVTGVAQNRWQYIALGGVAPIARIENGTTVELQYADALQNLMLALSPDGTVRGSFLYGAFGEVVASSGSEDHRRQFNGKENDASTGWRYYGFRSYDPLLLRWTSSDPLYRFAPDWRKDDPQRANLYAFTGNNPLRYVDPDGRDADSDDIDKPYDEMTVDLYKEIGLTFFTGAVVHYSIHNTLHIAVGQGSKVAARVLPVIGWVMLAGDAIHLGKELVHFGDNIGDKMAEDEINAAVENSSEEGDYKAWRAQTIGRVARDVVESSKRFSMPPSHIEGYRILDSTYVAATNAYIQEDIEKALRGDPLLLFPEIAWMVADKHTVGDLMKYKR